MFLFFSFDVLMWLIDGVLIHSGPVILANSVTLALALAISGAEAAVRVKFKLETYES